MMPVVVVSKLRTCDDRIISPELIMYIVPVVKFTRVCVILEPAMAKVASKRRPPWPIYVE